MDGSGLSDRLLWVVFVVGTLFVVTFLISVTGLVVTPPGIKHFRKVATIEAFEQESLGDFFKSVAKTQLLRNCAAYDAFQCNQAAACVMCEGDCVRGNESGPTGQTDMLRCPDWTHLGETSTSRNTVKIENR